MRQSGYGAALAVTLCGGQALAHAHLVASAPAAGSHLATAPSALTLSFSEPVEPQFTHVMVTAASGQRVDQGSLALAPARANAVIVPLKALAAGTYIVAWHALSVDTHKSDGTYRFTVGK